jgi:hypothetical protein
LRPRPSPVQGSDDFVSEGRKGRKGTNLIVVIVVESSSLEPLLLGLELFETGDDVGVDEVGDVLAVLDFGDNVVLPLVVLEQIVL